MKVPTTLLALLFEFDFRAMSNGVVYADRLNKIALTFMLERHN